jgi:hypothetical protein
MQAAPSRIAIVAAAGMMLAALAIVAPPAFAGELPLLSACKTNAAPALPTRWQAVGLMLPAVRQQIDVGEFTYDGSLPAMRATLVGMESGAVDLLITDKETYQLSGPADAPASCVALGRKYTPPATRWLPEKAVCDGEGPLWKTRVEWWKSAAPDGRANWQWYRADTRMPWRVMFASRSADHAVIGDYGIGYFPTFAEVKDTNLKQLRDFCVAKAQKPSAQIAAANTARELMAVSPDIGAAERAQRVAALVPGMSINACSRMTMPRWPQKFLMTGILSPVQAKYTPLPSVLYYDWDSAKTLYAWMHEARTSPAALELVSVLKNGVGYTVEKLPNGGFACVAKSPGAVRPDWMEIAGCECKAVIENNSELGPGEISQIRACPVKNQGLRVNWTWYLADGRPMLFTEPAAMSGGLNIADYLDWWPGASMPAAAFELPQLCTRATEANLPAVGNGLPPEATTSCSDCHTTQR